MSSPIFLQQIGKIQDGVLALPPVYYVEHIFTRITLHCFCRLDLFSTTPHSNFGRNALLYHLHRFLQGITCIIWNKLNVLVSLAKHFG